MNARISCLIRSTKVILPKVYFLSNWTYGKLGRGGGDIIFDTIYYRMLLSVNMMCIMII